MSTYTFFGLLFVFKKHILNQLTVHIAEKRANV